MHTETLKHVFIGCYKARQCWDILKGRVSDEVGLGCEGVDQTSLHPMEQKLDSRSILSPVETLVGKKQIPLEGEDVC